MKKLKLIALGAGIIGLSVFGMAYSGSSNADAQGIAKCNWNGSDCFDPISDAMCVCEGGPVED
ncbi:hypothetical protein LV84_00411 [Algoriphagus ratkowskyi]|uniref:Uncharacterized protein n=1 Tax=Algoriphagus ratkowskyi TaxID=57028 RepID=A0A2W7TAE5_9BACT|nr:hypothetical protein [Algoriphagus ratkowskyi]PZX60142.1 hypothetical protein LV84_00411 [Algoriphagus ratkowskyi]TXD75278.1 hypothetical protein ESW18_20960 [Algoriphagus ratkowskyi]